MATVWSSEAITRSTTSLIGPVRRAGDRPADRLAAATYASAGTGSPIPLFATATSPLALPPLV